jgi:hypothetical protein
VHLSTAFFRFGLFDFSLFEARWWGRQQSHCITPPSWQTAISTSSFVVFFWGLLYLPTVSNFELSAMAATTANKDWLNLETERGVGTQLLFSSDWIVETSNDDIGKRQAKKHGYLQGCLLTWPLKTGDPLARVTVVLFRVDWAHGNHVFWARVMQGQSNHQSINEGRDVNLRSRAEIKHNN